MTFVISSSYAMKADSIVCRIQDVVKRAIFAHCLKRSASMLYERVNSPDLALAEARENLAASLAGLHSPLVICWKQSNRLTNTTRDAIFSEFSVHHLILEEKTRFFRAVRRCLPENGWLVLLDVAREENPDLSNCSVRSD